jgi:HSP20 family protein
MTLIIKRRNGDLFPSLTNDLCGTSSCGPSLLDIDNDLWDGGLKVPLANITENKNEFKVDLSAPGLKKEDFKVEIEDGTLTISSEKKEESKEDKKNYKRREFSYSSFSRSFSLPENVQEDKINAKYDDGMLHVSIPKKEPEQSKPKKAIQVA